MVKLSPPPLFRFGKDVLERIFELWVGLYEHDYLGLNDVEAAREWLNTLIKIG